MRATRLSRDRVKWRQLQCPPLLYSIIDATLPFVLHSTTGPKMHNQFEFRDIPQWFVSIFALTYITGFLVDTIYYSSVGLSDISEVIKLRHTQLGLIFVMLFLIVTVPVFFLLFGRRKMAVLGENPNELPPMKPIMAFNAIIYFSTIYYVVVFVPPGYFYFLQHPYRLTTFFFLVFSVVFGYIIFISFLVRRKKKVSQNNNLAPEARASAVADINLRNQKSQNIFLYVMLFYIIILDYLIFEELLPSLFGMLYPYGIFFFLFSFMFAAQLSRIFRRLELDGPSMTPFAKVGFILIAAVGLLVLYYTTVASFAYTMFPHIPVAKGGANYADAPSISAFIDSPSLSKNTTFTSSQGELQNMILVYSTSTSFFFGSCDWRRGPAAILEVKKDAVKHVIINWPIRMAKIPDCPTVAASLPRSEEAPSAPSNLAQPSSSTRSPD